jgi:hypothetical protein
LHAETSRKPPEHFAVHSCGAKAEVDGIQVSAHWPPTSLSPVWLAAHEHHRLLEEGAAKSGDVLVQFGFGAGLAYAGQVLVLP